ncbi:hypothetical protein LJC23_07320 [Desulfovibrio sp. OttesenSCG-928-I05]|nr:hypothetical protein [Desulfovibrio sp. OttesenSCG-928-I05]
MAKKSSQSGTVAQAEAGTSPIPQQQASLLDKVTAEVTPEVSPLLQFITNNATKIVGVFLVCLALGVGYGAYQWHAAGALADSKAALGTAEVIKDPAERVAALEKFVSGAPAELLPAANLALAKAALESENYDKAAAAWAKVAAGEKGAFLIVAVTGQAEALIKGGKDAEALALLQKHQGSGTDVSRAMVDSLVVDLAEKNNNYAAAIAACESLAANPASLGEAEFWRQKAAALRSAEKAS